MKHSNKVDKRFRYTPALCTNLKNTFARIERERKRAAEIEAARKVAREVEGLRKLASIGGGMRKS